MRTWAIRLSGFSQKLVLGIFLLLCGLGLLSGVIQDSFHAQAFLLAVVCLVLAWAVLPRLTALLERMSVKRCCLLLVGLCLLVKLAWVLLVQAPIEGDYATFWGYANSLATHEVIDSGRYIALFPHIFGYAEFLSLFLALFGSSPWVPVLLNVLLSACSGYLLFQLCLDWFGQRAACGAILFWTFCPSQTMYNSLVLSEPLYTTLMLAFLLLVSRLTACTERVRMAAAGLLAGGLLRLIQATRPIGVIWAIAVVLWLLFLALPRWQKGEGRALYLVFLPIMLAAYVLTGPLWQAHMAARIGEQPSTVPGYSLLVGFNQESAGCWNQEDSDRLYQYSGQPGATAQWAQEQMKEDALARITAGDIHYPKLLYEKLRGLLGSDDSCVGYLTSVLRHVRFFRLICNGYYYLLLMLALAGTVRLWRQRSGAVCLLVPLYSEGLILAQMLVEVAGRYHYSLIPMLILLGRVPVLTEDRDTASFFEQQTMAGEGRGAGPTHS